MANPWFRMYNDFLDDPKLISLAFEDQRHYIWILILKNIGVLDSTQDQQLLNRIVAQRLWIEYSDIEEVKDRLISSGLITKSWQPTEWKECKNDRPPANEWRELRITVFDRDNYTCTYCGARGVKLECDHIHPVSRGGGHDLDNLTTACFSCNRSKRDKTIEEWMEVNNG